MWSVALHLRKQNFLAVIHSPKQVLAGLTAQWLALPLISLALVWMSNPPPEVALGIFLVASCPGGNMSNFLSHLGRGNTALSVVLTTITSFAAFVTTPAIFFALGNLYPGTQSVLREISVNGVELFKTLTAVVLIPLLIGLFLGQQKSKLVATLKQWAPKAALFLFIILIIGALYTNRDLFQVNLIQILLFVFAHNILALLAGFALALLFKVDQPTRLTVTLETGIQNSGLGLVIAFSFFSDFQEMILILAWWGIWHLISGTLVALVARTVSKLVLIQIK